MQKSKMKVIEKKKEKLKRWTKKEKEFIKKSRKKFGDQFTYVKIGKTTQRSTIEILCTTHNKKSITIQIGLHMGYQFGGCNACRLDYLRERRKLKFIEDAKNKHGNRFNYDSEDTVYVAYQKPIQLYCLKHGGFETTPQYHIKQVDGGCTECANERKALVIKQNSENFVRKAKEKHGNDFNYKKVKYISTKHKIKIICNKHSKKPIKVFPGVHLDTLYGGCKKCEKEERVKYDKTYSKYGKVKKNPLDKIKEYKPKTDKERKFLEDAITKYGNKYDYADMGYKNDKKKIQIKCAKHRNTINITPKKHLSDLIGGCEHCLKKLEDNKKRFLKQTKEKYGNTYDYVDMVFITRSKIIEIKCTVHDELVKIAPVNHLSNTYGGCTTCKKEGDKKEIVLEEGEILKSLKMDKYKDKYAVTNKGRCFNIQTGNELKQTEHCSYQAVTLDRVNRQYKVHILVYDTFNDDYDPTKTKTMVVDHIDGKKLNNNLENLRYVTKSKNTENAHKNNNNMSQCKPIIMCEPDGTVVERFKNHNDMRKNSEYNRDKIRKCLLDENLTLDGYVWKYEDPDYDYYVKHEQYVKDISGFVSLGTIDNIDFSHYSISKDGIVVNTSRNNSQIKIHPHDGYFYIGLSSKKKKKKYRLHRLIGKYFLPGGDKYFYDKKYVINHKDEKKDSNDISNLEWTTNRENVVYSIGKKVAQIDMNTDEVIKEFDCVAQACREINKQYGTYCISQVCKEEQEYAYGFKWEYIE